MIHAYTGNGKGKTTAAMGLALRAAGAGWRVAIVQFLKNGKSGETRVLADLDGVTLRSGKGSAKFTFAMTDEDRAHARAAHDANLAAALAEIDALVAAQRGAEETQAAKAPKLAADGSAPKPPCLEIMLVLDEALDALSKGLLDEELVFRALELSLEGVEVVFTGRSAPPIVEDAADYITRMECVRHPYRKGVRARIGVEL